MINKDSDKTYFYEQLIKSTQDKFEQIKIWHEYRNYFSYINPSLSLEIIERGCEFAKTVNEEEYYNMLFSKSNSLTQLERFKESYDLLINCLNFYVSTSNKSMIIKILGGISNIFIHLELFPQAIYIIDNLIKKYLNSDDEKTLFISKANLIQIYIEKMEYFPYKIEEIDNLLTSKEINTLKLAHPYIILSISKGKLFLKKNEYEKAIQLFQLLLSDSKYNAVNVLTRDIKFFLALTYKKIRDFKNMEKLFTYILSINKQLKSKNHNCQIYLELYEYYSNQNDHKKALESYENYLIYKKDLDVQKEEMNSKLNLFGYSDNIRLDNSLFYNFLNTRDLETECTIIIEDLNRKKHLINIQDIIYAEKNIDILKIELAVEKTIYSKINLKDLHQKINSFNSLKVLFFEIQQRSLLVNLFWLNNFDTDEKTLSLIAIDKSFFFKISKRQYPFLKKHLTEYNIIKTKQINDGTGKEI